MAAERVLNGLNELIREAVLAAVREELAAHKEEVNELRHTSSVVNERNKAADAVIHERERGLAPVKGELAEQRDVAERRELDMREMREELLAELVAVKGELAAVKGEVGEVKGGLSEVKGGLAEMRGGLAEMKGGLCEHKQSTALQLEEAERRRMAEIKEIRGQVEERERELAVVKRELAALKDAMIEQLGIAERSRESELRVLLEEVTKKADEMKAELAREREQAVEEFIGPRAMEELSYCRRWQHVDLEISQSEGDRRDAWECAVKGIA
ncbi:unnamed protein product [Closterium sp. NIES-65]|nr:unnamed protein product [Closterium sp. NIES-65]